MCITLTFYFHLEHMPQFAVHRYYTAKLVMGKNPICLWFLVAPLILQAL